MYKLHEVMNHCVRSYKSFQVLTLFILISVQSLKIQNIRRFFYIYVFNNYVLVVSNSKLIVSILFTYLAGKT